MLSATSIPASGLATRLKKKSGRRLGLSSSGQRETSRSRNIEKNPLPQGVAAAGSGEFPLPRLPFYFAVYVPEKAPFAVFPSTVLLLRLRI